MKNNLFTLTLTAALLLTACAGPEQTSDVSLYVTDDLGSYSQVSATINSVSLTHQNKDVQCVLFDSPQSFNFADLGVRHILELLSVTSCEASDYNRLTISLSRDVLLTNAGGTDYQCVFNSYKNEQGQPNVLSCDTNSCRVSLSGAINLLPDTHSEVALDFDLKSFEVDLAASPCTVTLKVSPLHAEGMSQKINSGYTRVDES